MNFQQHVSGPDDSDAIAHGRRSPRIRHQLSLPQLAANPHAAKGRTRGTTALEHFDDLGICAYQCVKACDGPTGIPLDER
jgi:hypothetical protein